MECEELFLIKYQENNSGKFRQVTTNIGWSWVTLIGATIKFYKWRYEFIIEEFNYFSNRTSRTRNVQSTSDFLPEIGL